MTTSVRVRGLDPAARGSIQPIVSHNVRILMAHKRLDQRAVGAVIGKTAGAVGHKLSGRSEWSADEIVTLALYGGPAWPIARFFNDPEGLEPTVPNPASYIHSIQGEGRDSVPRTPILTRHSQS